MKDLNEYTIEELVDLRDEVSNLINKFKDGYFYICKVRSYGRNWNEYGIYNTHTLQELCYNYDGQEGIVDVYSNNPDLGELNNYGDVMFVPTEQDYKRWEEYVSLSTSISRMEKDLDEWDNRENIPYINRPRFEPPYTREDLKEYKQRYENYDMSFVSPV